MIFYLYHRVILFALMLCFVSLAKGFSRPPENARVSNDLFTFFFTGHSESLVIRPDNLKYKRPLSIRLNYRLCQKNFASLLYPPDLSITKITIKSFFINFNSRFRQMLLASLIIRLDGKNSKTSKKVHGKILEKGQKDYKFIKFQLVVIGV